MTKAVVLQFKTYEDQVTFARCVEVKAIDVRTETPVASLPRSEMKAWLDSQGFRWLPGSSGIWERAA